MTNKKNINIFIDDFRVPENCIGHMKHRDVLSDTLQSYSSEDWTIVTNIKEFKDLLSEVKNKNLIIKRISFDHDLSDTHYNTDMFDNPDKYLEFIKGFNDTGYNCAEYFINQFDNKDLQKMAITVHSYNPIGVLRIKNLFKSHNLNCYG